MYDENNPKRNLTLLLRLRAALLATAGTAGRKASVGSQALATGAREIARFAPLEGARLATTAVLGGDTERIARPIPQLGYLHCCF